MILKLISASLRVFIKSTNDSKTPNYISSIKTNPSEREACAHEVLAALLLCEDDCSILDFGSALSENSSILVCESLMTLSYCIDTKTPVSHIYKYLPGYPIPSSKTIEQALLECIHGNLPNLSDSSKDQLLSAHQLNRPITVMSTLSSTIHPRAFRFSRIDVTAC